MKKIISTIFIMALLMVSMVSAGGYFPVDKEPAGLPTDTKITQSNDVFGEEPTFINNIGDFFGSLFAPEEFNFVSSSADELDLWDTTYYTNVYYGNWVKEPMEFYTNVKACDSCAVESYCEIYKYDPVSFAYWGQLFGDLYYVAYDGDHVNLGDYAWMDDATIAFGYKCFEPTGYVEQVDIKYSCRDGKIYKDGVLDYTCDADSRACEFSDFTSLDSKSDSWLDDQFCKPLDKCYVCVGDNLVNEYQDGCENGWTTDSSLNCAQKVTCYDCDGDGGVLTKLDYSCSDDWQFHELTEEDCDTTSGTTVCFGCQDGSQITSKFSDGCPSGYNENPNNIICSVDCYECVGSESRMITVEGSSCSIGLSNAPLNCEGDLIQCGACDKGDAVYSVFESPTCPEEWKEVFVGESLNCVDEGFKINQMFIILSISGIVFIALMFFILKGKPKKK